MATYPGAIKKFRAVRDLPGITYDANQQTTIYARDIGDLTDEVSAIEAELGPLPSGEFPTVAARFDAINPVNTIYQTTDAGYNPNLIIHGTVWEYLGTSTIKLGA